MTITITPPYLTSLQSTHCHALAVSTPGGGGYSLCDGWYICAAVLTPFFHFGRIEHDLFGVFFSSTNSKAIFWGTKTTNFYKNRSFWPQIQFFPRSFWVQFSAASGTPPSVFRPSTPPGVSTSCSITMLPFHLAIKTTSLNQYARDSTNYSMTSCRSSYPHRVDSVCDCRRSLRQLLPAAGHSIKQLNTALTDNMADTILLECDTTSS